MASQNRMGPSSQHPDIKALYTQPYPPLHIPSQKTSFPSRNIRSTPKPYTATSYIGPPGTYCHGQRPPPPQQDLEPDFAHDGYFAVRFNAPPSNPTPSAQSSPQTQIVTHPQQQPDPSMIAPTSRPHDPWDRCQELNCTKRGLHYHHLNETPPAHKRKREEEVYSESSSPDDDFRDWRRRRAAKQRRGGHSATYRRPRSLIAPGTSAATTELRDALPVLGSVSTRTGQERMRGEMTLPLRTRPLGERGAASQQPASSTTSKTRRVGTQDARRTPPWLPFRPSPGRPAQDAGPSAQNAVAGERRDGFALELR